MQAGSDREWAKPYQANPDPHEPHGSHIGQYSCLNIRNPEMGYHYAYGHRDQPGGIHTMQMMGFRPVERNDPSGTNLGVDMPQLFGAPQDELLGMGRLILMKIPLDTYGAHVAETERLRDEASRGPTQNFLDRAESFGREYGRNRPRAGAVYALPSHGETGYSAGEWEE